MLVIVILMGALGTFGYNFNTSLPLLAKNALGVDAAGYGALMSVMGAGSLFAALALASGGQVTPAGSSTARPGFTFLLGCIAVSHWYPVSLALMLPLGFASITFTTSANTSLQLGTPDNLRGRVMSLYTLLFLGSTPIGGLVTGVLAEHFGIQWTIAAEAAVCAAGVVAAAVYWLEVVAPRGHAGSARRSQRRRAEIPPSSCAAGSEADLSPIAASRGATKTSPAGV